MQSVIIDQEFKNIIPPQTAEEHAGLEAMIVADGCREPLITWGGTLVDGHNRYEICTRLNLPYETVDKFFEDRDAVCDWIEKNQLSRRNLTPGQVSLIIGRRYERAKKAQGSNNQFVQAKSENGQNVHFQSTAESIATEYGLNEKTVRRYGQEAALIDQHPEKAQAIIKGEVKKKDVLRELKPIKEGKVKGGAILPNGTKQNLCRNYAIMAMTNLDRIQRRDPQGAGALMEVMDYIKQRLEKEFNK